MPATDIEKPYQDQYTLAPLSRRRLNTGSVVHFATAVYTTFESFRIYMIVAIIYFIVSFSLTLMSRRLERHLSRRL